MNQADRGAWRIVPALRWIARIVFVVALLTWGRLAIKAGSRPETWAGAQRRTGPFIITVFSGMLALPRPKNDPNYEESY